MYYRYPGHVRRIVVDGVVYEDLHDVEVAHGDITAQGKVVGHGTTVTEVSVSQVIGEVAAGATVVGAVISPRSSRHC